MPVPEVAEGDQIEPCPVVLGTPVLSNTKTLHHGMVRLDWEDIEDAGWYVVQYYHVKSGEWLDLPTAGVDIAFHGSGAVVSNLHGLSWLRVRAVSCAGESEWSQIEELYGTNASDWEGVPVPEVAEGDEIEPCSEDVDTSDNSPATGAPAIGGTVQVGETLTADTSGIADADGLSNVQYEYQWLADDAEIAGATGSTYTVAAADEGKAIKVEVTFIDDAGNGETLTSAATDAVAAAPTPNSPATGVPAISGTVQVGETLTADTSGIADEDGLTNATFSYRWLADDTEIAGAASLTYTLVDADEGKAIKVEVSFTDDEGNNETLTSGATDAVAAVPPDAPRSLEVSLKDSGKLDAVWEAPASDGGSEVTGYKVQWKESAAGWDNPEDVSQAAASETAHTITGLTDGVEYAVRIIAVNDVGDSDPSEEAKGIPRGATAPGLAAAAVDGASLTLTYDETLDVDSAPDAGAFTVSVGGDARGVDAVSVTDSTVALTLALAVTADDEVLVSYIAPVEESAARTRDVAGNAAASFSNQPVTNNTPEEESEPPDNAPATGAPVITGTAQVGETLTANTSGVADADGLEDVSFTYRWLSDDAEIAGVTSSTYTLVVADENKTIKVKVTFIDDAGNDESLTSEATEAVAAAPTPNSPATGAPTIGGTAQVGETLTADTSGIADADGLDDVSFAYQWLADDADISGATNATYTLADTDEGKAIKVRVSFTDDEGNEEALTSEATYAVSAAPAPNTSATGAPTITGTAQVGETLTADTSGIADADGLDDVSFAYQWLADDSEIAGATGSTYTLADADKGKAIKVEVSFTDDAGNDETLTSGATDAVAAAPTPNSPATGAPAITGTAQVGETLTADTSGIADADGLGNVQYEHQWLADDTEIAGATSLTYTLVAEDEGKAIKVEVSFTDDAGNDETLTSAPTDTVEAAPQPNNPATGAPTINGTAQVGEALTADTSGIADTDGLSNVQYEHQWLADDTEIAGATGSTYTLVDVDEGKAVNVRVRFTDDAGNNETLTSAATDAVAAAPQPNNPATGAPTISGTAQVGEPLTADTSGVADADGLGNVQYEHQWLADDTEIAGATSLTYTLADGDEGKAVKVRVTFTDDEGNDESLTSGATAAVAAAEPAEPPAKPTGLSATATHDSVTLTWNDPQDDSITGYVILRRVRENDEGGEFSVLVADTGTAAITYTDATVAASTTYTYRIKAINGAGPGERSRWYHIDTPAAP